MLSISNAIRAGQGDYYLSLAATDDYYTGGEEPPGFWLGHGSVALGLSGQVVPDHFRNLLRGFSPDGEKKLVRNADSERRAGWDLAWSVPKSVSVAWSQASHEVQKRIEDCVRRAAAAGIGYLEDVAGVTRRGEDGRLHEKAKLLFACFQHSTSRAQDPQLHVHSILHNICVREDGSTGTIEPWEVYRHQHAADSVFRAELAALLERELGLRAARQGRAFELLGVDRDLIEAFSKRRAQVLEELNKRGLTGARAAQVAALDTREKKEAVCRAELFARWQAVGREHGWTAQELSLLIHAAFPPRSQETEIQEAAKAALEGLTRSKSHFTLRELTQALGDEAQGRNLGAKEVFEMRDALLGLPEVVALGFHRREQHWTTKGVLALEKRLLDHCEALSKREVLLPTAPEAIEKAVATQPELSGEQANALRHVCESGGGVRVVSGMAGTGKSTLFRAAREVWEAQGFTVHGAALSGKAARGLQDATGIQSRTLHRMLAGIESGELVLTSQAVLLIDEAAMVGTPQLARVAEVCATAGATLILAGDARQLQSIELGGGFAELSRRHGVAELTEIRRQREEWARQAVRDFASGEADDALSAFAVRGLVAQCGDEGGGAGAMERLIGEWALEPPSADRDCIILCGTNAEVAALNRLAQEARGRAGELTGVGVAVGKERIFAGDRVLFTRNSMELSVFNGDRGKVRSVDGRKLTVELDSGAVVEVDSGRYANLRLGYAMTTHKAQGITCEKSFVLISGQMTGLESAYVQGSRARNETRWYVGDDPKEVARAMEKSRPKHMASAFEFWAGKGPALELEPQL